jgi:peptidoglycan/LPS O-acetylase OafA/YrhL
MYEEHPSNAALAYRPDIDGLRAFAVIAVVIYHAFPNLLPGGFIGVDVFFVISGFLISSIIFSELDTQSFKFSSFYARRIKRIFPALIVILLVSFVVGWFLLFENELKQLGDHVSRAALFLSNFILWYETGYFDNAAETKPLLHLWSLGIEEQFYIVWPLVAWFLWRLKDRKSIAISILIVISFAWNMWQAEHDLTHDFYSPLTRFWELLTGALVAASANLLKQHATWQSHANHRTMLGALLLLFGVAYINANMKFPGVWAGVPVVGAALLISAHTSVWVNRAVLANRLLVWIGAISYPLYLWHWPILSFARIVEGGAPNAQMRISAVLASVLLAWLTFVCIERPIRLRWRVPYKTAVLLVCMLCVAFLGNSAHETNGYPDRDIVTTRQVKYAGDIDHDEFHDYFKKHFFTCEQNSIRDASSAWRGMIRCFQSKQGKPVDIVLLGDSHAEHLFIGMAEVLPDKNVAFYSSGALPMSGQWRHEPVFAHLLSEKNVSAVFVAGMWPTQSKEALTYTTMTTELDAAIKALLGTGKHVVLLGDVPQFDFEPQTCKFARPLRQSIRCEMPKSEFTKKSMRYQDALGEVKLRNPQIKLISLADLVCNDKTCSMVDGNTLLFRDNNHLNIPGSQSIGLKLAQKIKTD